MKLMQEQHAVHRSNVQVSRKFTITASAKAFATMTSNIYSDKPLAIIRELCCNGADSHTAAGCGNLPIDLVLPTRMNPQLIVRDYGTGLSHDEMNDVYTSFFESTKTDSNDFIGQLGLGSKSPFAMFKTFSIEARKDGIKRVYTAYLDEDGIPSCDLMSEDFTDERNGLSIIMTVKQDDIDKFWHAAKRALMYFDPIPNVIGSDVFEVHKVKHGAGGTNWKFRESEYWARMSGPYAIQGFVVYPIDAGVITEYGLSAAATAIASMNIDFWMDIGSVDVASSREALSYDKRTIANIAEAFERAAVELHGVIQAEFDAASSAYEAGCILHKYEQHTHWGLRIAFSAMHRDKPFAWKGKTVTYSYMLDTSTIGYTELYGGSVSKRRLQYSFHYLPTTIDHSRRVTLLKHTAVVIDDLHKKGSSDIIKQLLSDHDNVFTSVVILRATAKSSYNPTEIKNIIEMLGNPPVQYISQLPYTPQTNRAAGQARGKSQRLQFTGFKSNRSRYGGYVKRVFSRLTWKLVDVDLDAGGFYVPITRFDIKYNNETVTNYDLWLEASLCLGLITQDDIAKTYGFTDKEMQKVGSNWVNLFDHVKRQADKSKLTDIASAASRLAHVNQLMSDFNRRVANAWDTIAPKLIDGEMKTFVNHVRAMNVVSHHDHIEYMNTVLRLYNTGDAGKVDKDVSDKLCAQWKSLMDTHAMLKIVDWYMVNNSSMDHVIDYINMVAKQKG